LRNEGAVLSFTSHSGAPVLRAVARIGIRPIKRNGLKSMVVLGSLGVCHIQLSEAHNVFSVSGPCLMNAH
jgi:hypothetical protein